MATPLDFGLLKNFGALFPFLFVFIIVYAVLARTEMFREKQAFAAIIAFLLAIATMFSNMAVRTINMMAPWVVLLVIFVILLLLAYYSLGIKEETILGIITSSEYGNTIAWWTLALLLIIGLGSLSTVVSEEVGWGKLRAAEQPAPGQPEELGFWATIFHPKVLGMIVVLLIAMFTINKLSTRT